MYTHIKCVYVCVIAINSKIDQQNLNVWRTGNSKCVRPTVIVYFIITHMYTHIYISTHIYLSTYIYKILRIIYFTTFAFLINFYLFIYFWLHWVVIFWMRAFSSCNKWELLAFLTEVVSLVVAPDPRVCRLSSCGKWA